jgi:hypothetical protein
MAVPDGPLDEYRRGLHAITERIATTYMPRRAQRRNRLLYRCDRNNLSTTDVRLHTTTQQQHAHASTRTAIITDKSQMAFRLAREEGLFAGSSTGGNVIAALRLAEQLGPDAAVVTIMCDTGMKYLKTYGAELSRRNL